jgi:hypothetical protein
MADDDSAPADFVKRQADFEWRKGKRGAGSSPEALEILARDGVQAWREWIAKQQEGES